MRVNRKIKWLFHMTTILFWASLYMYVPYLTPYMNSLGILATVIGYISSSYGVAMLITRIPIGILADRMGKQKLFVLGGIAFSAFSAIGMQLTMNPYLIMVFRFLSGVAAATWVSFVTLYNNYYEKAEKTRAVAALNMYASLGRVFASIFGAVTATMWGYRGPFLFGGIVGAAALLSGLFISDVQMTSETPIRVSTLLSVGREKSLVYASLFGAVNQMIAYATTYTFSNTLATQIGAGETELGILQAITAMTGVVAPILLSVRWSRNVSEKWILISSFLMLAVSQCIFPFCRSLPMLYIAQLVSGMGQNLGMILLMSLSIRYISLKFQSTAMGYYQAVYSLGLTAGPIFMGYLIQYGNYKFAFCFMGLLALIAAILCRNIYSIQPRTN